MSKDPLENEEAVREKARQILLENQRKRKTTLKIWLLSLFVIITIGGLIIFIFSENSFDTSNSTGQVISNLEPRCREVSIPYEEQEEYLKTEYYMETVPYTDRECENKDLIYSATNDKLNYATCNNWDEVCYQKNFLGFCTNRTRFCSNKDLSYSVDINNLDEEQGTWIVNIYFYNKGNLYKTIPITQFLYPKTTVTFNGFITITGDSPSGDANQDYTAGYSIQSIPKKQVCRDVTKYKEVKRERQVTAYRPITKYKIERECR